MYKMKADGVVFFDPSSDDTALHVINPKAEYEVNKIDKLTFAMLPDNVMYDGFAKMVTIVTLEQDDEVIFRGRVMETTTDSYNMREVYCESELGYLHDSCVRPYEFEGKAIDLFRQLIAGHNEQVDEYKRFEVGIITAIDDETESKTDSQAYASTLEELRQMFVSPHRGYLQVRTVDGVRYLDYVKEFTADCEQPIEFGVNLVEIENKIDAGEVFSMLIPLGGYNTASRNDPVNITSVNEDKDYIEDADAIAKYGRIVKTYKWEDCKDPAELMRRGYEQFEKLKEHRTITIKAVDLHIIDTSREAIRVGKNVRLVSDSHRLNEPEACTKIELNIEKPDQTEYTFGYPPEKLTDSNAAQNRKTNYENIGLHKWLTETNDSFEVFVDEVNGKILLQADNILANSENLSVISTNVGVLARNVEVYALEIEAQAERVDVMADVIALKANQEDVDILEGRVKSAELRVSAAESEIALKATKESVVDVGTRVSAAEVRISGAESAIALKADLIMLDGYVKASDLEAETLKIMESATLASLKTGALNCSGRATVNEVWATGAVITNLNAPNAILNGSDYTAHSHAVSVNADGTITLGEVATTGGSFKIADTKYYKDGVSAARESGYNSGMLESKPTNVTVSGSINGSNEYVLTITLMNVYGNTIATFNNIAFDARDAYDNGYDDGYQKACDSVYLEAAINSISNNAPNTMYASGYARVLIGDKLVDYTNISKSQYFSWMGQ